MSEHYHDATDLRLFKDMRKLAPADFEAWLGLDNIVRRADGAIPKKYRELIAVAVACTTQCPYCIEAHTKAARPVGATRLGIPAQESPLHGLRRRVAAGHQRGGQQADAAAAGAVAGISTRVALGGRPPLGLPAPTN